MIEFLNQVIPDRKIVDLEFIDKEMLTDDVSLDKICKYTELSIEEIEALKA